MNCFLEAVSGLIYTCRTDGSHPMCAEWYPDLVAEPRILPVEQGVGRITVRIPALQEYGVLHLTSVHSRQPER